MEKIIVISTNNNPDYMFYSPYAYKAWKKFGWKVCTMVTDDVDHNKIHSDLIITMPKIEGLRQETIAQASRLYASLFFANDVYLMISDMDLIPLCDYWHPDEDKITSYGHDLTDYSFYPMGYIGMPVSKWKEVMKLNEGNIKYMERDAKELPIAYAADWETWWNYDWTLLTKRLKESSYFDSMVCINRGRREGSCYALGRIDRGDLYTIPNEPSMIDMHCENNNVQHPEKLERFLKIYEKYHGKI